MNTEISRYLVDENGNNFSSDSDLKNLTSDSKVKNTNSGMSYKKVSGAEVPVFDKTPIPSDTVLYDTVQQLTAVQKQRARNNIGALGSGSLPISFDGGTITHGESYTEIRFDLGSSSTGHFHYSFVVRIGSIALDNVNGVASVRWETPFWEHEIRDMKVQVTPSRGSNGGGRWGDDYFCLFTQNISHEGFEIYSNHLGDIGGGGRVDYIFTATLISG